MLEQFPSSMNIVFDKNLKLDPVIIKTETSEEKIKQAVMEAIEMVKQ